MTQSVPHSTTLYPISRFFTFEVEIVQFLLECVVVASDPFCNSGGRSSVLVL